MGEEECREKMRNPDQKGRGRVEEREEGGVPDRQLLVLEDALAILGSGFLWVVVS